MLYGVGTDFLKISRVQAILDDKEALDIFLKNTYTQEELELIRASEKPLFRYAAHFAGKEAVFKTLGISSNLRFHWNEIEILYYETGQPYVRLHGKIKEQCEARQIEKVFLSLSYDTEYVIAYAAAVKFNLCP